MVIPAPKKVELYMLQELVLIFPMINQQILQAVGRSIRHVGRVEPAAPLGGCIPRDCLGEEPI